MDLYMVTLLSCSGCESLHGLSCPFHPNLGPFRPWSFLPMAHSCHWLPLVHRLWSIPLLVHPAHGPSAANG